MFGHDLNRSRAANSIFFEITPNIVLTVAMALILYRIYMALSLITDIGIRTASDIVFTAIAAFFFSERLESTASLVGRIRKDQLAEQEQALRLERIDGKFMSIIHAAAKTRGITNLGNIATALPLLSPLIESAKMVRDITFRTDALNYHQYGDGINAYVDALWAKETEISLQCYQLITCQATLRYPKVLLGGHSEFPSKFEFRKIETALPNFCLFYDKDQTKRMVLGWPYDTVSSGDLFLIEDEGLVRYFEGIFVTLWRESKSYDPLKMEREKVSDQKSFDPTAVTSSRSMA